MLAKILFVGSGGRAFETGFEMEPRGLQIEVAESVERAALLLQAGPVDLVIADLSDEQEERQLVDLIHARCPRAQVVALGRAGGPNEKARNFLEGVKAGLDKPVSREMLTGALNKLNQPINRQMLDNALDYLNRPIHVREPAAHTRIRVHAPAPDTSDSPLVGHSMTMRRVRERILAVSRSDCPVLIVGESGTGKELAARSIHKASPRTDMPFIAVNCASLPDELLESELFGHARGSFSGATRDRKGLLEEAAGGTFLLDEIPSASPAIQAKLLRFLENKTFRRLGDNHEISCDVRILACSNADMELLAESGRFRADLLFRLDVVRIELPPLRDHSEDIPDLVSHFLGELEARYPGTVHGVSLEYQQWLMRHDFPGNVRELRNLLEAGLVTSSGGVLTPEDLPLRVRQAATAAAGEEDGSPEFRKRLAVHGREVILEALRHNAQNLDATARELGIGRTTLWRRMTEYGLTRKNRHHQG